MKKQCKIDAHIPTDDGSSCLCGYFVSDVNDDINRKDGLLPNVYDEMKKEYEKVKKTMNRQEIEKVLKTIIEEGCIIQDKEDVICGNEVLNDIFDTVIPEILTEIYPPIALPYKIDVTYELAWNDCRKHIKQKAKELYNIDL